MGKWKPLSGIYCIRNLANSKVYIGASTSINRRKAKHRNLLRSGKHKNSYMQKDFLVTRVPFEHSVLELCPKEKFVERESYWILFYDSINPDKGYNSILPSDWSVCRPKVTQSKGRTYVCINRGTKEIKEMTTSEIKEIVSENVIKRLSHVTSYWAGNRKNGRASCGGWVFVRPENYDPSFDYINYNGSKEYWKTYVPKVKKKKEPKIRTYENCKRTTIVLLHKITGEEKQFISVTDAIKELGLVPVKVGKCLNAPFKKYSHHDYWMKRL